MTKEELLEKIAKLIDDFEYDEVHNTYYNPMVGCSVMFADKMDKEWIWNGCDFSEFEKDIIEKE